MNNLYQELGFKIPKFLVNQYKIEIYIGTKDKDDWCVVIPKYLLKKKAELNVVPLDYRLDKDGKRKLDKYFNQDFTYFNITEIEAIEKAKEWTEFARKHYL